ncbi:hypothetical protein GQ53DRAFT_630594 [Thozetella sp. PMI_491]|nr:hypothetical protein GQ53DRAFT_630594 [Thozetella sp. PMI_491]
MLRSTIAHPPSSVSSTSTDLPPYTPAESHWASSAGPASPAESRHTGNGAGSRSSVSVSRDREPHSAVVCESDEKGVEEHREWDATSEKRPYSIEEHDNHDPPKYEGGITNSEMKRRLRELKQDIKVAGDELKKRSTEGMFKEACSTDLLFLMDTTGSMASYITAAKEQVKSITRDIKAAFLGQAEVRIAVVGYKDHGDNPNIEFLDFTSSVDAVHAFLDRLVATGGADTPEDILGGIRKAINASWRQQTRCIIHIADAPPHGRTLNDLAEEHDDYPEPGSEPHHLTHEPLLKQMIGLNLNYALLRINSYTDRMAYEFLRPYAAASAECKLLKTNKYYIQACEECAAAASRGSSKRTAQAVQAFEELELGTSYSALRHLVVRSVTTSASRTAVRMSASASKTRTTTDNKMSSWLEVIDEDEVEAKEVSLEEIPAEWDTPGWLDETLTVEGFSPNVGVHGASTLNEMMADDDNIKMSIAELTLHRRSRSFAQGALRYASYARTSASTNKFVVKSFKKDGKRLAHLTEDMRCQALCKAFAFEFNALCDAEYSFDFIVPTCLKGRSAPGSGDQHMSLEPFIEGEYVKYNNNCSYVNEDIPDDWFNQAAQAFSHFTFERSWGSFLVCDLQGVGHILTDPGIHTLDPNRFKLVDTNLGKEGFKFFFATHKCNSICAKLELKSNAAMIVSGEYEFREWWPTIDNTVCCSNKLCGRILRKASSKKSDEFPGCHWCETCWPQLESSTVRWVCIERGPNHDYLVSRFFYESQGRPVPRRCPEHREREATGSRTAVAGGNLWSRLKSATKQKTISGRSW